MSVNKIQPLEFIQGNFADYYKRNSSSIEPPLSMEKREFAFSLFRENIMLRHRSFNSVADLRNQLRDAAPSNVYYSSAYYEKPEEQMDEKGWIGADLVFDIDADHIPTQCNKEHDIWKCKNCDAIGQGAKPEKCPKCNSQKLEATSWLCETCLESAKEETIKLIEMLGNDFGFSSKEMKIAFSGHRGYHVHIESETIRTLDSIARKEIVDYALGLGLEFSMSDLEKGSGPRLEDRGWRGRIARGTYEVLLSSDLGQLEEVGLKKMATQILQQRKAVQESWKQKGPWKIVKGMGPAGWARVIRSAIDIQSVKIDTVVTMDTHRLIRLANTLHGETGLKKTNVAIGEIEGFDPLRSAIAFMQGTLKIEVSKAPYFRLGNSFYGPYANQEIELPTAVAMLLLCKGAARPLVEEQQSHVR